MKSKIQNKITIIVILSNVIAGSSCTVKDISIEKPVSESSVLDEITTTQNITTDAIFQTTTFEVANVETTTSSNKPIYPIISRPQIGEQFPVTSFVKSGVMLATVNSAEIYTNLYEAGAEWEDMRIDFRNRTDGVSPLQEDYFDRQSGNFLESKEYGKVLFVVVDLTLENHNAVSSATDFNISGAPKEFDDDVFLIDFLNICPMPEKNAESPNNVVNFKPLLWCSMTNNPQGRHPYAIKIPNGESITLKIGTMVQQTVFDEATQKRYGGQIGDDLISRLYLSTSNSLSTSMVYLELNSIS